MAVIQVLVEGNATSGWLVEVTGQQGLLGCYAPSAVSAEEAAMKGLMCHIEFTKVAAIAKERHDLQQRIKAHEEKTTELMATIGATEEGLTQAIKKHDVQGRAISALMRSVLKDEVEITREQIADGVFGPEEIVTGYLEMAALWGKDFYGNWSRTDIPRILPMPPVKVEGKPWPDDDPLSPGFR